MFLFIIYSNNTSPSLQEFQREQELVVPDTMVNNIYTYIYMSTYIYDTFHT